MTNLSASQAGLLAPGLPLSPSEGATRASQPPPMTSAEVDEQQRVVSSGVRTKAWSSSEEARLRAMVTAHFDFIWRSLRRLGVCTTDVDDCAQQVFWIAARKLEVIEDGCDRAFLFSTALRVASDARRSRGRRREVSDDALLPAQDPGPTPDEVAERRRARAVLDEVLAAMPMDLRTVFVLFELEEMATQEIAELLEIPTGTVASRLRRAREEWKRLVSRIKAKGEFRGGAA